MRSWKRWRLGGVDIVRTGWPVGQRFIVVDEGAL